MEKLPSSTYYILQWNVMKNLERILIEIKVWIGNNLKL